MWRTRLRFSLVLPRKGSTEPSKNAAPTRILRSATTQGHVTSDQGLGVVHRKCHAAACVRTCECTWCMHAGTQPYEVPTRAASLDVIPGCLEIEAPCRASGTAVGSSGTAWPGPGAVARIMYASAGNHGYFASGAPRPLLLRQCDPQLSEEQSTLTGIGARGWGRIEQPSNIQRLRQHAACGAQGCGSAWFCLGKAQPSRVKPPPQRGYSYRPHGKHASCWIRVWV